MQEQRPDGANLVQRTRAEREDLLPSADTGRNALPGKMCRPTEFAEVRPATIAANIGSSIQIRIGAAEIHVGGNAALALLRDILRVVSETC